MHRRSYSRLARVLASMAFPALAAAAGSAFAQAAPVSNAEPNRTELLQPGTMQARVAACTACHGAQGRAAPDGYYPRIAGKPQEYLYHQLLNFRDGRRQYAPMAHLLQNLPDGYLHEIAGYFSEQHPPYAAPPPPEVDASTLELGRLLATQGASSRNIPACAACHGVRFSGVAPAIPGLLGLPRDYIVAQIGSWRNGVRHADAPDCMADVARRLTPEDVAAVAAWLAAQTVQQPYLPQPAGSIELPVECGSQESAR
jgi:cytochrome c553